ncbi:unnamed protein product [Parajaminaea phylloscopi]
MNTAASARASAGRFSLRSALAAVDRVGQTSSLRRFYATVGESGPAALASSSSAGRTPLQERHNQHASPQDRRSPLEATKERVYRQYEKALKAKAAEEGLDTVEALAAKRKAQKEASVSAALGLKPPPPGEAKVSKIEKRDAEVAARIRAAAEKEAKRKLASGQLGSNPGGENSPVKPLSSILDLDKILTDEAMTPAKIGELWTGYHSLKGKLSAVIPAEAYERLVSTARKYPQFVLPLPRTIVGGDEDGSASAASAEDGDVKAAGLQSGEKKQGYEMQFMEWGFLPGPAAEGSAKVPPPTTVIFTPLAEYKLRQEFAQPLLVLTHYTDLAASKGVVLMRGDVTSAEEIEANPAGIAAAEAAKSKGASQEEQERLKSTPVQATATATEGGKGSSGGRMSEKDAQLLAMTMQRFYLPSTDKSDASSAERHEMLKAFHGEPESFSVPKLCEVAFTF